MLVNGPRPIGEAGAVSSGVNGAGSGQSSTPMEVEHDGVGDLGLSLVAPSARQGGGAAPFVLAGDEDLTDAYSPQVTISSWPTRASSDQCGWALVHRVADWAAHQARWLGARGIA
eukprot:14567963-Alexandrium_andersonii.AAC.1